MYNQLMGVHFPSVQLQQVVLLPRTKKKKKKTYYKGILPQLHCNQTHNIFLSVPKLQQKMESHDKKVRKRVGGGSEEGLINE